MKQITLAVALFISLFATLNSAAAQCNGNFGANSACGTVGGGLPGPIPFSSIISGGGQVIGPGTSTIGCAALWANTTGTQLANNCNSSIAVGTTTVTSASASNEVLTTGTVSAGTGTLANVATTALVFTTGTLSLSGNLNTTGAYNPTFAIGGSVTYTFPGSAANLASLNIPDQTVSGGANVTPASLSTGSITVDCGKVPLQYITASTSGWTITAPSNDGSCIIYVLNPSSTAGAITFSGFTVGSNTGDTYLTTANDKFFLSIARIDGVSTYVWKALQ